MADHSLANTACTTDSSQATGSGTSSVSSSGPATKPPPLPWSGLVWIFRDLEAASALGALGVVLETQWPSTEAIMHELSTDSEVTFRKVLGSAEVIPTRPGVDPLEVTRHMPDLSGTSQSPVTASPSVITSQPLRTLSQVGASCGVLRFWSSTEHLVDTKPTAGRNPNLTKVSQTSVTWAGG